MVDVQITYRCNGKEDDDGHNIVVKSSTDKMGNLSEPFCTIHNQRAHFIEVINAEPLPTIKSISELTLRAQKALANLQPSVDETQSSLRRIKDELPTQKPLSNNLG